MKAPAVPAGPHVAGAPPAGKPLESIGFSVVLLFLFSLFSRVHELPAFVNLHVMLVMGTIGLLIALFTGGFARALSSTPGKLLTLFTLWMVIIIPVSQWRYGSFWLVLGQWSRAYLCYFLVTGLVVTVPQCRRVLTVVALGCLTAGLQALLNGQTEGAGRLILGQGLLSNSNDLGQILLLGLPFWIVVLCLSNPVGKLVALVGIAISLVGLAHTGSRGTLIAFVVMMLWMFFKVSSRWKVIVLVSVIAALIASALSLPREILSRYLTILSSSEDIESVSDLSARESREARTELLKRSLVLTIQNPLFGVGPGVFQVASSQDQSLIKTGAVWKESHNTYTQVSSETGIPGFLLYIFAIGTCVVRVTRVHKAARNQACSRTISTLAFGVLTALVGSLVTSFFSSIAYMFLFPTLIGLSMALERAARAEVSEKRSQASESFPHPSPFGTHPASAAPRRPEGRGGFSAATPYSARRPKATLR